LVLAGRRLTWRAIAVAGAVTVAAVAMATAIDLSRPADSRTHLGRLVTDVRADGLPAFVATVDRKVEKNLETMLAPWSWPVVAIGLALLYALVRARAWKGVLPYGSALRAGVVAAVAAGLVGYAVNDSGVVVTALVFVYLGPFLVLLALRNEAGEVARIDPIGLRARRPNAASG
ncbi:MAG TPA: hypothetical protein VF230_13495, partial [Acidimicrobiales bacterium]